MFYIKIHTNILFGDVWISILRGRKRSECLNLFKDYTETKVKFSLANVSMPFTKFRVRGYYSEFHRGRSSRRDAARRGASTRSPESAVTQGLQGANVGWTWVGKRKGGREREPTAAGEGGCRASRRSLPHPAKRLLPLNRQSVYLTTP